MPGYLLYKALGYVWAYIGNTNKVESTEGEQIDPKEAKKLAKMQRKEAKGERVKYIKH